MDKKLKTLIIVPAIFSAILFFSSIIMYSMREPHSMRQKTVGIAVVFGNHANAMSTPNGAYTCITEVMNNKAVEYLCVIISDSTPTKVELINQKGSTTSTGNTSITTDSNQILDMIKAANMPADSPEVDLLQAISVAQEALNGKSSAQVDEKHLIICDTGISTYGALDFTAFPDLISMRPNAETVINLLQQKNRLPNLDGIIVSLLGTEEGLAEVAVPQTIDTSSSNYLRDLWTSILMSCDAKQVVFHVLDGWSTPNVWQEDGGDYPYVSPIALYQNSIYPLAPDSSDASSPPPPPLIEVVLSDAFLSFRPDTAEFFNKTATEHVLRPYAVQLRELYDALPNEKIWVIGTSAKTIPDRDTSITISAARANAVKEILVSFGVPEEVIVTIGLGSRFPWYDNDNLQENRAVWIITPSESSKIYTSLIDAYKSGNLLPEAMELIKLAIS